MDKPFSGQWVFSENYNYLNPTELLDLCCFVVQFTLWIVDLLRLYNTVTNSELPLCFTEKKDFVDRFVDI